MSWYIWSYRENKILSRNKKEAMARYLWHIKFTHESSSGRLRTSSLIDGHSHKGADGQDSFIWEDSPFPNPLSNKTWPEMFSKEL